MGEETVAELQIPDVDDAVKGVEALDVDAGDDVDEHDADLAPQAAGGKPSSVNMSPADAKVEAVALIDDDRLLQAARLLRRHAVDVPIANPLDATDAKLNAFVPKAAVMEDLISSSESRSQATGHRMAGPVRAQRPKGREHLLPHGHRDADEAHGEDRVPDP